METSCARLDASRREESPPSPFSPTWTPSTTLPKGGPPRDYCRCGQGGRRTLLTTSFLSRAAVYRLLE